MTRKQTIGADMLVGAILVFAVLMLAGCGAQVPDVKGKTLEQARKELSVAELKLGKKAYDASARGRLWTVVSQSPASGQRAAADSSVDITLAGAPPVSVPAVSGKPAAVASALASAGLTVGKVVRSYNGSVPAGAVVSQNPTAGADAPRGSAVTLVVSKGPAPVRVPHVLGKTGSDAKNTLRAAGFKIVVVTRDSAARKGTVLAQAPKASRLLQPGKRVVLTVSTGVELVTVPDVVRMYGQAPEGDLSDPDAFTAGLNDYVNGRLAALGLRARLVWVSPFSDPRFGEQSPTAGSRVPRGTTITAWMEM